MPTPPKAGQLKTVTVMKLKQAMVFCHTPEELAIHFNTSVDAATRMMSLVPHSERPVRSYEDREALAEEADEAPLKEASETAPFAGSPLHDDDPDEEPDDWSYRRMASMMELGSEMLRKRMLQTGCHWLPPEKAAPLMHQFGITEPEML